tara:strand:+ start:1584 stop:1934 length:351 start_codon:yes stop_codon:yes gene_type:complete
MINNLQKKRRAQRTRNRLKKSANLRLSVFRSNKHIYGQLIDDSIGKTLLASSSHEKSIADEKLPSKKIAFKVGEIIGDKISKAKIISKITFDRGNYLFHGRVKELAMGVKSKGIKF